MRPVRVAPLALALVALLAVSARADGGRLDPTFGDGGIVVTHVTSDDDFPIDVAQQPDGKLVVVGSVGDAQGLLTDLAVIRYNPDGALDQSFGSGGIVITHLTDDYDSAHAVVIQPDRKILVAGIWGADPNGVALVRYNPDGSLDQSFGSGGIVLSYFSPENSAGLAVAVLHGGQIVVAGTIERFAEFAPNQMLLAWYEPDGSLIRSTFISLRHEAAAQAISLQKDGRMLVGGSPGLMAGAFDGHHVDTSFGDRGFAMTQVRDYSRGEDMAVQPDGAIVVSGLGDFRFSLVRYTAGGVLDPTFGEDGIVTTRIGDYSDATGVQLQPDGKLLASGLALVDGSYQLAVARYLSDGTLDPTFGRHGVVTTPVGANVFATGATLQSDGKLVVVGRTQSQPGVDLDWSVVRYLTGA